MTSGDSVDSEGLEEGVLFTDGNFRIINTSWWFSKQILIQHACPLGYAAAVSSKAWINWRSYGDGEHLLDILDPAETHCLGCRQVPSEGLRTMFVFLRV